MAVKGHSGLFGDVAGMLHLDLHAYIFGGLWV